MICGIVCEYNPFHNGHLYQINKAKESSDAIVCVMSGNFVQRGECAYADKWTRAETAVKNGANLVIDLPTPWSNASAGTFARGSIGLLSAFGIDILSFGSETDDASVLLKCAEIANNKNTLKKAKDYMSSGITYPTALAKAVSEDFGKELADVFSGANNTLAIEYIKAANELGCSFSYLPIKRFAAMHDSNNTAHSIASASKIRQLGIKEESFSFIPQSTAEALKALESQDLAPCSLKMCESAILSALREMPKSDYELYVTDTSGLASRIYQSVQTAETLEMLYENAKSKNYTLARVRREVLSLFLKIPKSISDGIPPYIRVLAADEKGIELLKSAKSTATLPIVTKHSDIAKLDDKCKAVYEIQCSSTDKFSLCSKKIRPCGLEQTRSMSIIK